MEAGKPGNGSNTTAPSAQQYANYDAEKQKLIADIKSVASDAEQLARSAMNSSAEALAAGRQQLAGKLSEMRSRVEDAQMAAAERARWAADATQNYVAENPWKSVGVAAAAGLIIGLLLARPTRHD